MTEQAKNLLDELYSSGRLEHADYSLLWDALEEAEEKYDYIRLNLVLALDSLKAIYNHFESGVIHYSHVVEEIKKALSEKENAAQGGG